MNPMKRRIVRALYDLYTTHATPECNQQKLYQGTIGQGENLALHIKVVLHGDSRGQRITTHIA